MSQTLTIKPRDGLQVRQPDGRRLPEAGATVTDHPYWRRRLRDGDVVKTSARQVAKATGQANQNKE